MVPPPLECYSNLWNNEDLFFQETSLYEHFLLLLVHQHVDNIWAVMKLDTHIHCVRSQDMISQVLILMTYRVLPARINIRSSVTCRPMIVSTDCRLTSCCFAMAATSRPVLRLRRGDSMGAGCQYTYTCLALSHTTAYEKFDAHNVNFLSCLAAST